MTSANFFTTRIRVFVARRVTTETFAAQDNINGKPAPLKLALSTGGDAPVNGPSSVLGIVEHRSGLTTQES
jgi:hypothetical protein